MKTKKAAILLVIGLFLISFPWMPKFFIHIRGDDPDHVYGAWYKAQKSWENADYPKAIAENLQALWMTVDFETRVVISKPFYKQSRVFEEQGQIKEAIDACMTGANIIGKYDQEGLSAYHCFELEMQYNKALHDNESVAPTIEP
jgi:hypothetical protein